MLAGTAIRLGLVALRLTWLLSLSIDDQQRMRMLALRANLELRDKVSMYLACMRLAKRLMCHAQKKSKSV